MLQKTCGGGGETPVGYCRIDTSFLVPLCLASCALLLLPRLLRTALRTLVIALAALYVAQCACVTPCEAFCPPTVSYGSRPWDIACLIRHNGPY